MRVWFQISLVVRPPAPFMLRCYRLLADSIGSASHSLKNNDGLAMLVCAKQSKTEQAVFVENRRLAAHNKQIQLIIDCLSFAVVTKFVPIARVLVSFLLATSRLIPKSSPPRKKSGSLNWSNLALPCLSF